MNSIEEAFHAKVDGLGGRTFVAHFSQATEWHSTRHQHACPQLIVLTGGAASVQTAAGRHVLLPDRCLYLPMNTTHSMDTAGPVRGFAACLGDSVNQRLPTDISAFNGSRLLLEILRRLSDLTNAPEQSVPEANLIRVLLDEIQRSTDQPLEMQMPIDRRLREMANNILQHLGENRTLEEWAAATGISKRTILRRFKEETGLPVGQWVQHARVFSAATQLRKGVSVKHAASSVGYDSVSSFIKSFTRIMGVTPGSLRPSSSNKKDD
ncbi:MAG: AraC family transcriptional regulator [Pseudomonadota bacterium]|uniref:helix-turn-helix domain-containing protein n=1 Tax=Burkholderiaceae TaxID=119060 RepID=UPI0010F8BD8F|nr:AraC family transcriptional regulator [Burkholderia sp. 4M9327F10]